MCLHFSAHEPQYRILWWRDSGKHKLILLNNAVITITITGKEYDGHMTFEGSSFSKQQ